VSAVGLLQRGPGALDAARIRAELDRLGARFGRPLSLVLRTASTNDDAKRAAAAGIPHGAVFLADAQTHGRGRSDHRWHSPPGENVYLSLVLRPTICLDRLSLLSLAVGVAVARTVDGLLGHSDGTAARAMIKWPNDVYLDARKIAGVLCEAVICGTTGSVIAGVGINLLGERFPEELAPTATSLVMAGCARGELDRSLVAARLIDAIGHAVEELESAGARGIVAELARRNFLRDRWVRVGEIEGLAQGIDAMGRLEVREPRGTVHRVHTGEVLWR
jgi:BirA family biotin operon repressor/biotin-[acetyl-CoA-carboxylase] ligase